jgi:hypothetical protein
VEEKYPWETQIEKKHVQKVEQTLEEVKPQHGRALSDIQLATELIGLTLDRQEGVPLHATIESYYRIQSFAVQS